MTELSDAIERIRFDYSDNGFRGELADEADAALVCAAAERVPDLEARIAALERHLDYLDKMLAAAGVVDENRP